MANRSKLTRRGRRHVDVNNKVHQEDKLAAKKRRSRFVISIETPDEFNSSFFRPKNFFKNPVFQSGRTFIYKRIKDPNLHFLKQAGSFQACEGTALTECLDRKSIELSSYYGPNQRINKRTGKHRPGTSVRPRPNSIERFGYTIAPWIMLFFKNHLPQHPEMEKWFNHTWEGIRQKIADEFVKRGRNVIGADDHYDTNIFHGDIIFSRNGEDHRLHGRKGLLTIGSWNVGIHRQIKINAFAKDSYKGKTFQSHLISFAKNKHTNDAPFDICIADIIDQAWTDAITGLGPAMGKALDDSIKDYKDWFIRNQNVKTKRQLGDLWKSEQILLDILRENGGTEQECLNIEIAKSTIADLSSQLERANDEIQKRTIAMKEMMDAASEMIKNDPHFSRLKQERDDLLVLVNFFRTKFPKIKMPPDVIKKVQHLMELNKPDQNLPTDIQ
jgi:hypothetical protein